jgi:hypothetical protein
MGAVSHAIIDYVIAIILTAGPAFVGFGGPQAKYAYLFSIMMFTLGLLTRYPLGVAKAIRFPVHGAIELLIALLILILPWLANFSRGVHSRNFFVLVGILMLSIWVMTDFRGLRRRAPIQAQ